MEQPIAKYQKFGAATLYIFIAKYIKVILITLILTGLVIYGLTFLPTNLQNIASPVTYGVVGLSSLIVFIYLLIGYLEYSHYRIEIYKDFLKIIRGVIVVEEVGIPYKRIVEIKIYHSLSEKMIGLTNIRITVFREDDKATRENESLVILPALTNAIATEIQHGILERTNIGEMAAEEPVA